MHAPCQRGLAHEFLGFVDGEDEDFRRGLRASDLARGLEPVPLWPLEVPPDPLVGTLLHCGDGLEAVRDPDAVGRADRGGVFALEGLELGPEQEPADPGHDDERRNARQPALTSLLRWCGRLRLGGGRRRALAADLRQRHGCTAHVVVVDLAAPGAVVTLKPGTSLDLGTLTAFMQGELQVAVNKLPEKLLVLDTLPRSPNGKVVKPEARTLFA